MSQGFLALPPTLIQSLAVLIRSAAGTTASISFIFWARSVCKRSPLSRYCKASAGGRKRGKGVGAPAPGEKTTLIFRRGTAGGGGVLGTPQGTASGNAEPRPPPGPR